MMIALLFLLAQLRVPPAVDSPILSPYLQLPPFQATGAGSVARPIPDKLRDVVSVCDYIGSPCPSGGDDTVGIQAARDYANGATGKTTVVFPPGTYNYSASPNWAIKGVRVRGLGTVTLNFTGTGNAWSVDFGSPPSAAVNHDVIMENLTISGNASATNGLYVSGCDHCVFRDIRVTNVSAAGVAIIRNTVSRYDSIRVSNVEGAYTTTPVNGILCDQNANAQQSSANTITHVAIEGVSGSGLKFGGCFQTVVAGGTSESNGRGIELATNSARNTFIGLDLEGNSTEDISVATTQNQFHGVLAISSVANATHLTATARQNKFYGGLYGNITLDAGAYSNAFFGIEYKFGAGAFTDNSSGGTIRVGIYDNALSAATLLATTGGFTVTDLGVLTIKSVLQANLGTPANGTLYYCSDCTTATACTGGGAGAFASRQAGAWKCL